ILYQFLTGERPFAGSTTTTMQKVLKEDPLPPSTLNVQLPPAIDAVVRKALAKRPDDRYATAHEFAQALQGAVRTTVARQDPEATVVAPVSEAAPAPRPSPAAATPMRTAAPAASAPLPPTANAPQPNSRNAFAIVAGVAVIGVIALAA